MDREQLEAVIWRNAHKGADPWTAGAAVDAILAAADSYAQDRAEAWEREHARDCAIPQSLVHARRRAEIARPAVPLPVHYIATPRAVMAACGSAKAMPGRATTDPAQVTCKRCMAGRDIRRPA